MKGLKLEPGWRNACVTWLNLLRSKSKPPTSARRAPSLGRIATNVDSTCGICAICQAPLSSRITRMTAPRRILVAAAALSPSERAANLSPSPVTETMSPSLRTALISVGEASSTIAALRVSLSLRSWKARSRAFSSSPGSLGRLTNDSGPR